MDRPVMQSDRVIVQFETNNVEYVIHQIDKTNIYIQPIDGGDLSLIYFDGTDYVIQGAERINFELTPNLVQDIGDPNVLINILSKIEYPELVNIYASNKEINKICQMDDLWRTKLLVDFGFDISTDKSPEETLMESIMLLLTDN